jgi:hypothetical protein
MAKRKTEEKDTITCVINKEFSITLKNVMETMGMTIVYLLRRMYMFNPKSWVSRNRLTSPMRGMMDGAETL